MRYERDNSSTLAAIEIGRRTRETDDFKAIRAAMLAHVRGVLAEVIDLDPVAQVAALRARGGLTAIITSEMDRLVGPLPSVPVGTAQGSPLWERHNLRAMLRMEIEPIRQTAQGEAAAEINRRERAAAEGCAR